MKLAIARGVVVFLSGFAAGALLILALAYFLGDPPAYDMLARVSPNTREWVEDHSGVGYAWMRSVHCLMDDDRFLVAVSADARNASMSVTRARQPPFPHVMLQDCSTNGVPDNFVLEDRQGNTVLLADCDEDGVFDSLYYEARTGTNLVTAYDNDMDGRIDVSSGPGSERRLRVDDRLYVRVRKGEQVWVETETGLRRVYLEHGEWRFRQEDAADAP